MRYSWPQSLHFTRAKPLRRSPQFQVTEYRLPYFRSQIPHTGVIPLLVYPLQFLEKVLYASVIVR
ncbi:hypothetical protein [Candidatus Methylomirabilis sp.]|uniref:hypothetical protein n=1 Tax=Candidatus Methylomirabilis sp. TaxID=2032687 RepID=UPI003C77BA59